MSDVLLRASSLSKRFKLYDTSFQRLADWLRIPPAPRFREFWALRDITFELSRGHCLGVIGPNGAGKSTLLKLLTGSLLPTSGELEVHGRVLSLLELGTGFNVDLTGRANVEQSASLLGVSPSMLREKLPEIEAFADIGAYFDRPLRHYSTGMLVRLAFSMFSAMEPEVFLVDEALAVGDLRFSSKAIGRIREMIQRGTTLLLVSHDLQLINQLCDRAIWLHTGTIQMDGDPVEVTRAYQQFVVHGDAANLADTGVQVDESVAESDTCERELALGGGWHELEAFDGEVFRWATSHAEMVLTEPIGNARVLRLDVAPGPSGDGAVLIQVVDEQAPEPVQLVVRERGLVDVPLGPARNVPVRVEFVASNDADEAAALVDGRSLSWRLFGFSWADGSPTRSVARLRRWVDPARDADMLDELNGMQAALRRCVPAASAPARITFVATRNQQGDDSARFATHEPLRVEVRVEADRDVDHLVIGLQIRDSFDRVVSGTRTDWQGRAGCALGRGDVLVQSFDIPRLILGTGRYMLTAGIVGVDGSGERLWQWVDGVRSIQVLAPAAADFTGPVDLGIDTPPPRVSAHAEQRVPIARR